MMGEFVVEYDYPHDWRSGGVIHCDTVEEAIKWAESKAKGRPGYEGYCSVYVYQQTLIKKVN